MQLTVEGDGNFRGFKTDNRERAMKRSTRNRLRGKIRQIKGKTQEVAGKIQEETGKIQQDAERKRAREDEQ